MTYNEFKECVIAACAEAGITEYELYYQAGSSVSIDTFRHEINEFTASRDGGVCFRCIANGKMGYACAMSVIMFIIIMTVTMIQDKVMNKSVAYDT